MDSWKKDGKERNTLEAGMGAEAWSCSLCCKRGLKDFGAGASHSGRQSPRTRKAVWGRPGRGQRTFQFLKSMASPIYTLMLEGPEGRKHSLGLTCDWWESDYPEWNLYCPRLQEVSILFKSTVPGIREAWANTLSFTSRVALGQITQGPWSQVPGE